MKATLYTATQCNEQYNQGNITLRAACVRSASDIMICAKLLSYYHVVAASKCQWVADCLLDYNSHHIV